MTEPIGSTALVFQAPPALPDDETDIAPPEPVRRPPRSSSPEGGAGQARVIPDGPLRMLKGARQAAAGMKISDDAIREVLEDPHEVQPDPTHPERRRLTRGPLTVTTGQDGMILRVTRRK